MNPYPYFEFPLWGHMSGNPPTSCWPQSPHILYTLSKTNAISNAAAIAAAAASSLLVLP